MLMANGYILGFVGWLFGLFTDKIIAEIELPKKWKHNINMFMIHLIKNIRNSPSEITYVFKTQNVEYEEERFYNIHELIEEGEFKEKGQEGSFLTFTKEMGLTNPTIYFMPVFIPDNGELYLASIEFQITIKVKYRTFIIDMQNLFRIKEELQYYLGADYGKFIGESITMRLSKLNRFTGFLSEFNMSTLTGKLHGSQIIFNSSEMILMGPFNSDILTLLKKAITFYY